MTEAHELPLWFNHAHLGYINIRRCLTSRAPFFFDLDHNPIYVDDFCRQTGLKRTTWRESIRVEKDGEIVSALPLITPPDPLHSPVRRIPVARRREIQEARRAETPAPPPVNYFGTTFSMMRPPPASYTAAPANPAARGTTDDRALALVALAELAARTARPAHSEASEVDEEKVCVICHEDLTAGQRLAATDCGHVFCVGCISMSLIHSDACPTCRTEEPGVTVLYI
jgi:hypothetical protein